MSLQRLFRPRTRVVFADYGHEVRDFDLPNDGAIEYAQWLHPYDVPKVITQPAVDAIRQFVSPGDFVIDIGAHSGDTTVPMALAAGQGGCTLALEPNPYVFKVLAANADLNCDRTNIVPRCCMPRKRTATLSFTTATPAFATAGSARNSDGVSTDESTPLKIQGRNLLDMLETDFVDWLPKLSYIKVDAEGYDRAILESIRPIIRGRRPVIRTEVYRKLMARERFALFDLLDGASYRIHRFQDDSRPLGDVLDRSDMTREKHFDVIAIPR